MFEPAAAMFSPITIKYLSSDWPGVFWYQMLHLMPAGALGKHFDAKQGCPTRELHGMAGAIFLKEYFDLTIDDFVVDEDTQTVECCPNGHEPVSSVHDPDKGRTRTVMDAAHCSVCPCRN